MNKQLSAEEQAVEPHEVAETITEDKRGHYLFKMASNLREQGFTQLEILATIKAVNDGRCDPPLSVDVLQRICDSACRNTRGSAQKGTEVPDLKVYSGEELQNKELPSIRWIVSGMIPQGLAILASLPKYGKSWWVLDLCLSVAAGDKFMGHETEKMECLYLALEDSENRLQDRINKLTYRVPAPKGFRCAMISETLDDSRLITQLERHLKEYPGTGLIVIDTLQKVKGAIRKNESAYADDYRQMSTLKRFADDNNICVLVVHHLRKGKSDSDVFERISGTNGIFGSVDTAIVMQRVSRISKETTMHIVGRDVMMDDITIVFDQGSCRWQCKGPADNGESQKSGNGYETDPVVITVKKLLEESESKEWKGTAGELLDICIKTTGRKPATSPSSLGRKISQIAEEMSQRDQIQHFPPGKNGGSGGRAHTFRM